VSNTCDYALADGGGRTAAKAPNYVNIRTAQFHASLNTGSRYDGSDNAEPILAQVLDVLIIEDNPNDALLNIRALQRGGYDVRHQCVENEPGLLKALEAQSWDLILCDYTLPSLNGPNALALIRENLASDVPVIFVSGTIDDEKAVDLMLRGAQDFVRKGHLTRLVGAVERELRNAAIRREKRRLIEALDSERQLLRQLMDNMPEVIVFKDAQRRYTHVNHATCELFGVKESDLIGKSIETFETAEGISSRQLSEEEVLASGLSQLARNEKMMLRDGVVRWFSTSRAPLRDPDGTITGLAVIARDVTDSLKMQEQLAHAQKMEAIGALTGGIAHDFNNLLTIIVGNLDLLLDSTMSLDPSVQELIADALAAASSGGELCKSLLAFSRRQSLRPDHVDVGKLVLEQVQLLSRTLGDNIAIKVIEPDETYWTIADATQLRCALMNLAVNARDAMTNGGTLTIALRARVKPTDDSKEGVKAGQFVCIEVSDTGVGISAETVKRIFEPFFTTKEVGKGTGLGLSMVYGFVEQSGGTIDVVSEVGKGTTFSLYLPRVHEVVGAGHAHGKNAVPSGKQETILVVDDDISGLKAVSA
jgi:PAS domain S-box-containing protein